MSEDLLRIIIGDIASNINYGIVMKKWREMLGIRQGFVSKELNVKQSVISDYENERCKNPGIKFVRDYSLALIKIAKQKNPKEYFELLKSLDLKEKSRIVESFLFKKSISNKDLMGILKVSQLSMPNEDVSVKNCLFFSDKASKLLANRPSYNLLKSAQKEDSLFVFLNVKTGNFPVILINFILGNKLKGSKKILLFQSEKLKLSWIAKRLAKSNNLPILLTNKPADELLELLKNL